MHYTYYIQQFSKFFFQVPTLTTCNGPSKLTRVNFNFPYVYTGHYYLKIFKFFFRETIKFYKYRRPQLNTWSGLYVLRAIEVD